MHRPFLYSDRQSSPRRAWVTAMLAAAAAFVGPICGARKEIIFALALRSLIIHAISVQSTFYGQRADLALRVFMPLTPHLFPSKSNDLQSRFESAPTIHQPADMSGIESAIADLFLSLPLSKEPLNL